MPEGKYIYEQICIKNHAPFALPERVVSKYIAMV